MAPGDGGGISGAAGRFYTRRGAVVSSGGVGGEGGVARGGGAVRAFSGGQRGRELFYLNHRV